MDRENGKNGEQERSGSRYDRRESLQERSGSRYDRRESQQERSGSRYDRKESRQERSGSRYDRKESLQERSGSRYDRKESPQERSGSRYEREDSPQERSGSRYGHQENPLDRVRNTLGKESKKPTSAEQDISRHDRKEKRQKESRSGNEHREKLTMQSRRRVAAVKEKEDEKAAPDKRSSVKRSLRSWDPVRVSLICLAAVAVTAYIVVAVYYGGHFYSGSQIYGIDCSKKTSGQVKQEVMEKIGEYTLTVEERGGKKDVITAAQIGLQYQDDNGIEQQLKKQRCYIWPAMLLLGSSGSLTINTTYDRAGIDRVLEQMNCFLPGNIIAPRDAFRGDTEDGYEVVPEVMGTTLNYDKTKEAILDALDRGLTTVSLDSAGCYIDPLVYQDDPELNAEVEELNSLLTARITYDFSDRQEIVDASVIKEWICKDENGAYYIDDNHVWAYVADLAAKYDTFGGYRVFYTSFGTAVELSGGDYGWAMDQDATAEILAEAVKAGKTETIQPQYVYTAMDRSENDIGGTYVEVCISRQEMWCYQDGVLMVDTPVVTGNPNKDNATPSGGVWAIDAKMQDYVLRGEGYESPVDYWMPFNGDVGIHDMQTRYYFGGTIYLTNGSHGCVNTPYDAAQTIYNIVSIGTPVVVYE